MIKYNVLQPGNEGLEIHADMRGVITDVFFGTSINHVALIRSVSGSVRGNHYHRETVQSILITKGSLEYWYKPLNDDESPKMVLGLVGDVITSSKDEIHAMKMLEDSEFIAFTVGKRGGSDYESDTIRVNPLF